MSELAHHRVAALWTRLQRVAVRLSTDGSTRPAARLPGGVG